MVPSVLPCLCFEASQEPYKYHKLSIDYVHIYHKSVITAYNIPIATFVYMQQLDSADFNTYRSHGRYFYII